MVIETVSKLGSNADPETVRKMVEEKLAGSQPVQQGGDEAMEGRAILTSFGMNRPGVVANITKCLSDSGCDILDISQKIMQEFYTMIMLIDITNSSNNFREIQDSLSGVAEELKIKIFLQHEDVFNYMHRI